MAKQIGKFVEVTNRDTLDLTNATVDSLFAKAIIANAETLVVKEKGLLMVRDASGQTDGVKFPIVNNFDLTWSDISSTGKQDGVADTGTIAPAATWKNIVPIGLTANIFVHDEVGLTTNGMNFDMQVGMASRAVAKKIEITGITDGLVAADGTAGSLAYSAGSMTLDGTISAGDLLTPSNVSTGKNILETGAEPQKPDVLLVYNTQYLHLKMHADFSETSTSGAKSKAVFDPSGNLIEYDNLEIIKTRLMPAGTGAKYDVAGHPALIFQKGLSGALCTKNDGFRVNTKDDRLMHGQYKIFDIRVAADILVPESILTIRCADE